ncbi:MAG: hypothetical protein MR298_06290 [Odoribacter sp.]|nr:hypothetical protein [Odoribacter sp.]MDY3033150.1 DUF6769 family protein [Odoribacter sp.]
MMKLKKFTTIFFLILASIVMLTFTVVPHHHHQDYICFNSFHCEDGQACDKHSHDENNSDNQHNCIRNLLQTQISRTQSILNQNDEGQDISYLQTFFLASHCLEIKAQEATSFTNSIVPYQERLHSVCCINTQAGRAPPIL